MYKEEKREGRKTMKKEEFQEMIGQIITDREYEIIETVYMYHPSFDPESGGDIRELVRLSDVFGMTIFCDMYPRAEKYKELEDQLHHAQAEVDRLKDEMVQNRATMGLDYSRMLDKLATPEESDEDKKEPPEYLEERKNPCDIASKIIDLLNVECTDGFSLADVREIFSIIEEDMVDLKIQLSDS